MLLHFPFYCQQAKAPYSDSVWRKIGEEKVIEIWFAHEAILVHSQCSMSHLNNLAMAQDLEHRTLKAMLIRNVKPSVIKYSFSVQEYSQLQSPFYPFYVILAFMSEEPSRHFFSM